MSAACNGCGRCCEVIGIPLSPTHLAEKAADVNGDETTDVGFAAVHWQPLSIEAARAINPLMAADWARPAHFFYTCDQYDAATRQCLAQEQKPQVCRDFPWYGGEPNAYTLIPYPDCSYRADLPVNCI